MPPPKDRRAIRASLNSRGHREVPRPHDAEDSMKVPTMIAAMSLLLVSSGARAQPREGPLVRVTLAPPAMRHEVAPMAPSPRHLWVGGHWAWRGNAHAWLPEYWAVPPGPGHRWAAARWQNTNGAWTLYEGRWTPASQPVVSYAHQPPPPARFAETPPPMAFANAVWSPGHWQWSGSRRTWIPGRWWPRHEGNGWRDHG